MIQTTDFSTQLSTIIEKLIASGIDLGERILGAIIIFIIGKFFVNWVNKLFAKILAKRKVEAGVQTFLKSMVNILLLLCVWPKFWQTVCLPNLQRIYR